MTAAWPLTVPQDVLKGSYSEEPDANLVRYETEIKPGKVRRRSTAKTQNFSFQTVMTDDQLSTFIAFFENDIQDGALSFTRNHPRTGVAGTFLFSDKYTVREHSGAKERPGGMAWVVSLPMMLLP